MSNQDPIFLRRSIRSFKDIPVPKELIERLAEAADAAPSACNKRPVNFYFITNYELLNQLSNAGRFTKFKSPLMVVVTGDLRRALPLSFSEYWIQDASAACENILVEASALGLGSCWCGVLPQKRLMDKVSEILGLDQKEIPFAMLKIGYAEKEAEPHSGYSDKRVKFID